MRWTKKIILFIICGVLTFSVTSTAYYKSVHAMEWVGGALVFEEALKWLLAAIGITATAGMTDAYWDTYGDDFTDFAIENGATQTEVAEWQLKACQGIIDKGSVVWEKFKAWASSLVNGASGNAPISYKFSDCWNFICDYYGISYLGTIDNSVKDIEVKCFACSYIDSTHIRVFLIKNVGNFYNIIEQNSAIRIQASSSNPTNYYMGFNSIDLSQQNHNFNITNTFNSFANGVYLGDIVNLLNDSSHKLLLYNFNSISTNLYYDSISGGSGSVSDSNFESVTSNVDDLDVISSDGVDESNPEVTVPMPGVSDSDNEASKDAYQDIIDAINDGTITQEQGVEQIQEILKIVTYDTVTDKVVPPQQNEDGTDKTKDDVLKENNENMGFTLGGLEAVFPFCIPFDIYAFMTLLVAEPECPEFDFPIKSVNGQVEEIHVDLEPFEPVAVVVRYVFDFLFIIGLAMLTRSLIGGGSSD